MITYAEKWWIGRNRCIKPLTSAKAEQRHQSRLPYVAVFDESSRPTHVVSCGGQWVSVRFLDSMSRSSLVYSFKEVQSEQLFLSQAHYWKYEGECEEPFVTYMFTFDQGGELLITTHRAKHEFTESRVAVACLDGNWVSYPLFGEYSSIMQRERILPSDDFVFGKHQ
jgi:hypothetical protein